MAAWAACHITVINHFFGKARGEPLREQLVLIGLVAQRDGARLIFPDRFQDLAEGRVDGAKNQEKAEQEPGENDVIEHGGVREIENSEQVALRNALDAVFTMGERRLQI